MRTTFHNSDTDNRGDTMVYHLPYALPQNATGGSSVRPVQMLAAFRRTHRNVFLIEGHGKQRQKSMQALIQKIDNGLNVDFVYSESSTQPNALTEPNHFPRYWRLDRSFFRTLNCLNVPIGVFYRDIYWRFPVYKQNVPLPKRLIAQLFYWHDWHTYQRYVDHLFLPSQAMSEFLPTSWPASRFSELPPACTLKNFAKHEGGQHALRLFYVGGIAPPLYDIRKLFEIASRIQNVELTVCCRQNEWATHSSLYEKYLTNRTKIVHASGQDLNAIYSSHDISVIFREHDAYLDFAMPVKVFEALGHTMPLLVNSGTAVSDFVTEEQIGWCVNSVEDAVSLLRGLQERDLAEVTQRIKARQQFHTWDARAIQVQRTLRKITEQQ